MTARTFAAAGACLAGLLLGGHEAHAGTTTYDISGGSQWRTTDSQTLGQAWAIGNFDPTSGVAATPYGNSVTALNPNRVMWDCGLGGELCLGGADAGLGPTEVYFGYSLFIKPGASFSGAAAIIADDFFDLVINGQEVMADTLDGNRDGNGQPVPLTIDLTPWLRTGNNVLALRAMDGYRESAADCTQRAADDPTGGWLPVFGNYRGGPMEFCKGNRELEYMFISGSVTVVPEPGALSLVGLALLALGLVRRQRP